MADWQQHPICVRADGSYVITRASFPCHVPNAGEWTDLYAAIAAYVSEHPEAAVPEAVARKSLAETKEETLRAVILGANQAKAKLASLFSRVEEATWPEQEAGARSILGAGAEVKNMMARLIMADDAALAGAVALVEQLAAIDGATPAAFAARIVANADTAHTLGMLTLTEQRALEAAVKAAASLEDIAAIDIAYTVLQPAQDSPEPGA